VVHTCVLKIGLVLIYKYLSLEMGTLDFVCVYIYTYVWVEVQLVQVKNKRLSALWLECLGCIAGGRDQSGEKRGV